MKVFEVECVNENLWKIPEDMRHKVKDRDLISWIGVMLLAKREARTTGQPFVVDYIYTDGFEHKATYTG